MARRKDSGRSKESERVYIARCLADGGLWEGLGIDPLYAVQQFEIGHSRGPGRYSRGKRPDVSVVTVDGMVVHVEFKTWTGPLTGYGELSVAQCVGYLDFCNACFLVIRDEYPYLSDAAAKMAEDNGIGCVHFDPGPNGRMPSPYLFQSETWRPLDEAQKESLAQGIRLQADADQKWQFRGTGKSEWHWGYHEHVLRSAGEPLPQKNGEDWGELRVWSLRDMLTYGKELRDAVIDLRMRRAVAGDRPEWMLPLGLSASV